MKGTAMLVLWGAGVASDRIRGLLACAVTNANATKSSFVSYIDVKLVSYPTGFIRNALPQRAPTGVAILHESACCGSHCASCGFLLSRLNPNARALSIILWTGDVSRDNCIVRIIVPGKNPCYSRDQQHSCKARVIFE